MLKPLVSELVDHLDGCSDAHERLNLAARALYSLGVHSAYTDLSSSPFESGQCMKATTSSLWFMGHTASKWREHDEFEGFLEGMNRYRGNVRFLLSEDVSIKVADELRELEQRYSSFRARIYFSRPMFRLVIQDGHVIALQHYEGRDSVPVGDRDDSPLMILMARGEESLFRTLVVHFLEQWQAAKPVGDL
jgi:hypothetical protein